MPHLVPEVCKAVVLKCIGQLSIIQAGFSMCTFYLFWLCSLSIPTSQVCKHLQSRTVCNNRYGSTQRNCPKQSSVLFNRVRISFLVSLLAGPWQGARLLEDGQVGRKAAEERKSFRGQGGPWTQTWNATYGEPISSTPRCLLLLLSLWPWNQLLQAPMALPSRGNWQEQRGTEGNVLLASLL